MSNYYDTCLTKIQALIQENKKQEALELLEEELSMPYIPKLYREAFEELYFSLNVPKQSQSAFFTNMDEIKSNLMGNEAQIAKALVSLEHLNLRPYLDDLIEILKMDALDDSIKRVILFIAMEQELSFECFVVLGGTPYTINIGDIKDPFEDLRYIQIYHSLHEVYESQSPSFLKLALDVLHMEIMQSFPFVDEGLSFEKVVNKTQRLLNQG